MGRKKLKNRTKVLSVSYYISCVRDKRKQYYSHMTNDGELALCEEYGYAYCIKSLEEATIILNYLVGLNSIGRLISSVEDFKIEKITTLQKHEIIKENK